MDSCELQYSCGQENRVAEPGGEQVGGGLGERGGTVKGGGGAGEFDRGGRRGDPAVRDLLSRFTIGNVDFDDDFDVEVDVDYEDD